MQHTKQHQGRGVHCDLQVQRLASSSAINYLNGRCVPFWQAVKWNDERANSCCCSGKFVLAPLHDPPQELKQLFEDPLFLVKVKSSNSIFAFTSTDAAFMENALIDELENAWANVREGVYTFPAQGNHRVGTFLPVVSRVPSSIQLYIFDRDMEAQ